MRLELLVFSWLVLSACSTRTHNLATSRDAPDASTHDGGDAGPEPDAGEDAARDASGWIPPVFDAGVVFCGARPCACSNGASDDDDGLVDGEDPECTGAFDDDEASFATGVPDEQQRPPRCQDCYFDRVPGRDVCSRPTSCLLSGQPESGNGQCSRCEVPDACRAQCAPLAPNGCDCFGCCEVWRDGARFEIKLEASCSIATLGDRTRCTPCTRAPDCLNPCDTCELCPGRGIGDLPLSCGTSYTCVDTTPCRRSSDCGPSEYCQHGCCLQTGF